MQLNELIEMHTVKSIAQKTNIAAEVIDKLLERDFKTLKKPQALGAISIIEREYDIDLDTLRNECKAYYAEKSAEDEGLTVLKPIRKKRRFGPRFVSLLLLVLLAFAAWYFFVEYYQKKISPFELQNINSSGNITRKSQVVDIEQEEESIPEQNNSDDKVLSVVEEDSSEVAGGAKSIEEYNGSLEAEANEGGKSREEEALPVVKEEQSDSVEVQKSTEAVTKSTETVGKIAESENEAAETVKEASAEEAKSKETPVVSERESIMLIPKKKMWFRLINADNKKSRELKRKDRYEIDLKKNDWLFAAQNAEFAIIYNNLFEEYSVEGKIFFRFDKNGVHRLSEEEYRAAAK